MNKEELLQLVKIIDSLTPSTEKIPPLEVSDKLVWSWSEEDTLKEHSIKDIEIDGYFCIEAPIDIELIELTIKKGEYFYEYNTYKGDNKAFGSKIHVSSVQQFSDEDIDFFLD